MKSFRGTMSRSCRAALASVLFVALTAVCAPVSHAQVVEPPEVNAQIYPDSVPSGQFVNLSVNITNPGSETYTGGTIEFAELAQQTAPVQVSDPYVTNGTYEAGVWRLDAPIGPGETASLNVGLRADAPEGAVVTVTPSGTLTSESGPVTVVAEPATLTIEPEPETNLEISKSITGPRPGRTAVMPGERLSYHLAVTNTATTTRPVMITDLLRPVPDAAAHDPASVQIGGDHVCPSGFPEAQIVPLPEEDVEALVWNVEQACAVPAGGTITMDYEATVAESGIGRTIENIGVAQADPVSETPPARQAEPTGAPTARQGEVVAPGIVQSDVSMIVVVEDICATPSPTPVPGEPPLGVPIVNDSPVPVVNGRSVPVTTSQQGVRQAGVTPRQEECPDPPPETTPPETAPPETTPPETTRPETTPPASDAGPTSTSEPAAAANATQPPRPQLAATGVNGPGLVGALLGAIALIGGGLALVRLAQRRRER